MNDDNRREYAQSIRLALKAAQRQAEDNYVNVHIPTPGQRGAVIGIINRIAGGDDNRKLMLGWLFAREGELFDKVSTKALSDEQWAALYAWCDFRKDEERVIWMPKDTFATECLAVLSAAMDDYFKVRYTDRGDLPEPPEIVAVAVSLEGEITTTGARSAGLKGVPDELFEHEKDIVDAPIPESPYAHMEAGKRLETEKLIESLGFEKEVDERPAKTTLKPVFQNKPPKLYNPFD